MQDNLREFLRHGGSGLYVLARQNGAVYPIRAGHAKRLHFRHLLSKERLT